MERVFGYLAVFGSLKCFPCVENCFTFSFEVTITIVFFQDLSVTDSLESCQFGGPSESYLFLHASF